MPRERKTKTPTEALTEVPVVWRIGDRQYTQRALSISGTTRLLRLLSEQISTVVNTPFFASLAAMDMSQVDAEKLTAMVVAALAAVPDLLPKLLTVMIGAPDEDAEYIADNAAPSLAIKIVETFLDQNEPEVLVQGFFGLGRRIKALIPKTTETPSESPVT